MSEWRQAIVTTLAVGVLLQVALRIAAPLSAPHAHAVGLSIMGPAVVLAIAIFAPTFRFGDYLADRGRRGVALDAGLGAAACLVAAWLAASWFVGRGTGTLVAVLGLAAVVYVTAFAVFTARTIHYFDPISEGVV